MTSRAGPLHPSPPQRAAYPALRMRKEVRPAHAAKVRALDAGPRPTVAVARPAPPTPRDDAPVRLSGAAHAVFPVGPTRPRYEVAVRPRPPTVNTWLGSRAAPGRLSGAPPRAMTFAPIPRLLPPRVVSARWRHPSAPARPAS